jgi:peptidoglycan hydrolase CwlO-like protein
LQPRTRRRASVTCPLYRLATILLLAAVIPTASAGAQGEGTLRNRIGAGKAQERSLSSAAARLGALERRTSREIAILQGRLAAAQAAASKAEIQLADTQTKLDAARKRANRLRKRLAEVRRTLAGLLRQRYMGDHPDFVTVVLHADGFNQLLETLSFVRRVQKADTRILNTVRSARLDSAREQTVLTALEQKRSKAATALRIRRDALASMNAALENRRATYARAKAARLAALSHVRTRRRAAERELSKLLAARAAAASSAGPGGPWAIPWPIVQCESGGQNLPPNYATASGYYQMLDSTWKGLGGSTPHAYQASKAEQDRLAARLWNGGAGASNWVCASLVST